MPENDDEITFDDDVQEVAQESPQPEAVAPVEQQDDLTPEAEEALAQLNQIEALADIDPSLRESDEYKNLMSVVEKGKAGVVEEEEYGEEEEEEYDEGEEEEYDEEEEEVNPFGISKSTGDDFEEVEFEIEEEMEEYIKSHYGLENVETFFDSVDTWRNQAQKGAESSRQYEELVDGLQELPQEIKSAIHAFTNAEDYHAAFKNAGGALNYDADFEDQDKDSIVNNYFSEEVGELEKELDNGDIDEDDYEGKLELLYKSARKLFNSDKKMVVGRRAEIMKEQEEFQDKFSDSISSSVDKLRQEFPNFSKKDLQKVRQRLVNEDINSLFFNDDGTYKEGAAEALAYSMYGKQVVQSLLNGAEKDGITQANTEIVKRGSKKPRAKKTQQQQRTEAMDAIGHLQGQFAKNPYE
jgi:hypothetical protein